MLPAEISSESLITTVFCDGEVRHLTFRRQLNAAKFFALVMAQAISGRPYPARVGHPHDQHAVLVTLVEKDLDTREVLKTATSGLNICEHIIPPNPESEDPHGIHR